MIIIILNGTYFYIQNDLESYAFQMKQTVEDDKVKDKISADEVKTITDKCDDAIKWLDANQTAEKDEFEYQKKELEKVCTPIITKMYQGKSSIKFNSNWMS